MFKKVICIGDSITYGYPFGSEYSWVNLGAKKVMNVTVMNKGINGDTSEGVVGRFTKDVINHHPNYVLITIGTNDTWRGITKDNYVKNLQKIYRLAKSANINMIIGLPIPAIDSHIEENLIPIRSWLKSFSTEHDLITIDFFSKFKSFDEDMEELYTDSLHPSKQGYKVMGELFANLISKIY